MSSRTLWFTREVQASYKLLTESGPLQIINMEHKEEEVDTSVCTLGDKKNIPSQKGSALDKGCKETMS